MADLTKVSHAGNAYVMALKTAIQIAEFELTDMKAALAAAQKQLNPPRMEPPVTNPPGQGGDPIEAVRRAGAGLGDNGR
jgi:hypothetical protein